VTRRFLWRVARKPLDGRGAGVARFLNEDRSMHRTGLALALVWIVSGCGGNGSGGDDGPGDAGDGADGPDGSVGPGEPADGQFTVVETHFGADVFQWGNASGTILDPRPRYHRLEDSSGACRLWKYTVASCDPCAGLCDADGVCVPPPHQLEAGDVTVQGGSWSAVLHHQSYGYYPAEALPNQLFDDGDEVTLTAAGGDEVGEFSLRARGAEPVPLDLERGQEGGDIDALRIEDGADLVLNWSPTVPGARVRLELLSNNGGHGLPVDVFIECEADDGGRLTVPRTFIEAFPDKPYQNACAGTDCPPSSLMRFRSDRVQVGERDIDVVLRVGAQRQFIVIHEPR
jgi:hypothetical protein